MQPKILISGAAGYVGGSLVADFLSRGIVKKEDIVAAVRSSEQEQALSCLDINTVQLDLTDEKAVTETVTRNRINVVIHTASSIDPGLALPLIAALSKQQKLCGSETFFFHTSGLSGFYPLRGWPSNLTDDTGPVFATQKQLADSYPTRKTDVAVTEYARAHGVTSFIVVLPPVYGRGTGPWNKLSTPLPILISAFIRLRQVYKFPENVKYSVAHISDATALYGLMIEKTRQGERLPHGEAGYYLAIGHSVYWHEILEALASALSARDLVSSSKVETWKNGDEAAEKLGVPAQFVQQLWNARVDMVASRPQAIGWRPRWDARRFLENIDDEINSVLEEESGRSKSMLLYLFQAATAGEQTSH